MKNIGTKFIITKSTNEKTKHEIDTKTKNGIQNLINGKNLTPDPIRHTQNLKITSSKTPENIKKPSNKSSERPNIISNNLNFASNKKLSPLKDKLQPSNIKVQPIEDKTDFRIRIKTGQKKVNHKEVIKEVNNYQKVKLNIPEENKIENIIYPKSDYGKSSLSKNIKDESDYQSIKVLRNEGEEVNRKHYDPVHEQSSKGKRIEEEKKIYLKSKISCYVCKKELTTDKNTLGECNHTYCNDCINKKKYREVKCKICCPEVKTIKSVSKDFQIKKEEQKIDSKSNFESSNTQNDELYNSLIPNHSRKPSIVISMNSTQNQDNFFIKQNSITSQNQNEIPLHINLQSKIKLEENSFSALKHQGDDQKFKIKTELISESSINNEIIEARCTYCNEINEVKGFLCNHNLCIRCLTLTCCYQIRVFFVQYQINHNIPQEAFRYNCCVYDCNEKISVPTALIIARLYKFLSQNDQLFEEFRCLIQVINEWIPYFDGLTDLIYKSEELN